MEEKKPFKITEEELKKIAGGAEIDVSKYSEKELAQIFQLYLDMYGEVGALPYLNEWGVTSGDYYLMSRDTGWDDHYLNKAPFGWKLAHLVYMRNHR